MKSAKQSIQSKFNMQRHLRSDGVTHFGGMDAAVYMPLAIQRFRPDEGGTVSTQLDINLAPVSGYMRSNAYVEVKQVFVPYQAIEKLELDSQDDAGVTEMTRRRLLQGSGIGLEDQNDITKAAFIHPKSVGGDKRVSKTARLAYICAVNHLRKAKYFNATLLDKTATAIQPATLTANVLERFNGVLEPENLVDGAINLTGELPVKGVGVKSGITGSSSTGMEETGGDISDWDKAAMDNENSSGGNHIGIKLDDSGVPQVYADLSGAGDITLRDLMQSRILDGLVRDFARVRDENPQHGEELIERALFNITVDFDADCHVLYDHVYEIRPTHMRPTDGPSFSEVSANFAFSDSFATLVPRSELGGQLVTVVAVKPLETLAAQPSPVQTETWELINIVHDQTELDETLLTRSDLETDVTAVNEDTPVFWVGHNALKHRYHAQGANPENTHATEQRSAMWLYEVPTSVTPDNINYDLSELEMYPFYNWNGAEAEYTITQRAAISTPLALGPTPLERIELFKDDPSLVADQ